jgi:hypothetical protein
MLLVIILIFIKFILLIIIIVDSTNNQMTAYIYFLLMNFVTNVIMLNLFILVVLQQYDDFEQKKENPIEKFNDYLEDFKEAWNKYSTEYDNGFRISSKNVTKFMMDLKSDLIPEEIPRKLDSLKKYEMELRLLG